jgi:hypothetical protein
VSSTVAVRPATPELVIHRVGEVLRQDAVRNVGGPIVIGVRASPRWDFGPVTLDGIKVVVVPCPSPLAMRAAFAEHLPEDDHAVPLGIRGPVVVVLTDVAESDLGDDLLARMIKPHLFNLDVWQTVRARLGVRRLDPALGEPEHRWLADALLDVPSDDMSHRNAVLGIDRAVDLVATDVLGITHVSIEQLVLAGANPKGLARYGVAPDAVRDGLAAELKHRYGPVGALVMGAIRSGRASDLLPLGLACRALVGSVAGSYGLAQIELVTDVHNADDAGIEAFAVAAELAFGDIGTADPTLADDVLGKADLWVRDLKAPNPGASRLLRTGFEARLTSVGLAVAALMAKAESGSSGPSDELIFDVRGAIQELYHHREAQRPSGLSRAEGAVLTARLAMWVDAASGPSKGEPPSDLASNAADYLSDGAWVDWARRRVFAGDTNGELAAAQRVVVKAADARRSGANRRFAEQLAHDTNYGEPGAAVGNALPVESVIDKMIVPLAKKVPVLLVVLDGCGLPAFLELAPQFRGLGLIEYARGGVRKMGIAALPTVTQVSRMSLLAGGLDVGDQSKEKQAFASNVALNKLDGPAPVVFHAADLRSEGGSPLSETVRTALGISGPRVVAAVINTIDDQLSKGTFTAAHRIEDLGALRWLLSEAIDTGRAVVMTADHGHVFGVGVDGQGTAAVGGEGGERWREADRPATEDEVLLKGPRVMLGGALGVLAPWHDVLRYAGYHGGYHGGATPDEVLVPLSVYLPAGIDQPDGWEQAVAPAPAWWDLAVPPSEPIAVGPTVATRRPKKAPIEGQGEMFGEAEQLGVDSVPAASFSVAGPAWIDQLLSSTMYSVQVDAVSRGKPPADRVRATLIALDKRGGVASFDALAAATTFPLPRIPTFLATLTRVLNVDGYPVLTVDQVGSEARLDPAMARTQFLAMP